ncbi:hypothetical protein TSUD_64410 [Trifolium subterraneum]|uniref:Uncharacterized protein n=1 Tax=Trifolium subterraneum TaxID=3900 RepID=A0A2Z6MIT0_TRISU|nr:hypothetical protein TSUD_64410 [Trifolium subterraneum]
MNSRLQIVLDLSVYHLGNGFFVLLQVEESCCLLLEEGENGGLGSRDADETTAFTDLGGCVGA